MPRKTHSNDSNRACRCNLSGWLQGGGCGNDFHEHQARYGQGREGRDVAAQATMISNTTRVHNIASLIGGTALSPHSPTESRSLVMREETDINPLTPEVLQRISSHWRSRERPSWAWSAMKLRYDARTPLKHFQTPSRRSGTNHQGSMKPKTEEMPS